MANQKTESREQKEFAESHPGLSDSTKRAQWINSPDEHADHDGQTLATRNHEVIKRWAQERDARPATVPGTEHNGEPGVLRFNFPGYGGDDLKEIDRDEWFKPFDRRDLVFLFQEKKSDGHQSNFFRLDNPNRGDG
jgi:hypothetical protein